MTGLGRHLFLLMLSTSCGSGPAVTDERQSVPSPPEAEATVAESHQEPEPDIPSREIVKLAELLDTVGDRDDADHGWPRQTTPSTLADAISSCDEEGICWVTPIGAFDSSGTAIVLSVVSEESGHQRVTLIRDDGNAQRRLLSFDAFGQPLPAVRRRLRRHGRLAVAPNMVTARSLIQFSLAYVAVLVALSAPLDGWVLWLETTGIEAREQRLHLMRPDGSDARHLASRAADVGPCDGGGYWCEINRTDRNAPCTADMLEAEGRLCTLPMSADYVAVAPNGHLLVVGSTFCAGHCGGSSSHWMVMLPADLRPSTQ